MLTLTRAHFPTPFPSAEEMSLGVKGKSPPAEVSTSQASEEPHSHPERRGGGQKTCGTPKDAKHTSMEVYEFSGYSGLGLY